MGGDLIQHVIEEADAGADFAVAFAVQPDVYINGGFARHAVDMGVAVAFGELVSNRRPVQGVALVA